MDQISQKYFREIVKLKPNISQSLLTKSILFATLALDGQVRKSGEPYVIHVLETGKILAEWNLDDASIVAGILHDSVDDGAADLEDVAKEFGIEVRTLVDGVSRLGKIRLKGSGEDLFVENLRKMFVAMAKDLRVVVIKIADRLHNMRTIQFVKKDKQPRIAKETLEIFAPLADRLQMGKAKAELEDLAFGVLWPEELSWTKRVSSSHFRKIEFEMEKIKRKLLVKLKAEKITGFEISARKKHLYSLYRKLLRPEINRQVEKVADFLAFRILAQDIDDCYRILGVINSLYKQTEGTRVSDFIARPKANGYQSLHMKVNGPTGRAVEIQIRTYEMHKQAEYGIAAHFHYAEEKAKGESGQVLEKGLIRLPKKQLLWVEQLLEWHRRTSDNKEFYEGLTQDFLSDRIFVLTPKGDVINLPVRATPIDFAYAVHTNIGNRAVGAIVDGKALGFDYKLRSGEVCQILTSKDTGHAKSDWLKFVVTRLARHEILKANGRDR